MHCCTSTSSSQCNAHVLRFNSEENLFALSRCVNDRLIGSQRYLLGAWKQEVWETIFTGKRLLRQPCSLRKIPGMEVGGFLSTDLQSHQQQEWLLWSMGVGVWTQSGDSPLRIWLWPSAGISPPYWISFYSTPESPGHLAFDPVGPGIGTEQQ